MGGYFVEFFAPCAENNTRPLMVWIVGIDIEGRLLFIIGYDIIFSSKTDKSKLIEEI